MSNERKIRFWLRPRESRHMNPLDRVNVGHALLPRFIIRSVVDTVYTSQSYTGRRTSP
jgi:hypothetical protein